VKLIETEAELAELAGRLRSEPLLAVDTEAASFHRYLDRVYLLQISSRAETAVVDPLATGGLGPIGELLADPAVEIIFHDADYDLRLLNREYGFTARSLFDTRIAAQLLNEPGIGLAALLEKYFGVKLDKRFQRADWSARPLSAEMLAYAAADTHHLPQLRDIMRDRLSERGRLGWANEEFALLEDIRPAAADQAEPGWLRLKGAKALRGRELAILRELWEWRDGTARRADRATFRILNNEPMLAMAKNPPSEVAELKAIPGVSSDQAERRGRELLDAVKRGLDLPEADLPRLTRTPRRAPDLAYEVRLERLKAARNLLAQKYDLPPGVVCPNGTLEAIARTFPKTYEELATVAELRRWQLREFGGELLAATLTAGAKTPGTP
jgi:ribonuclease D